MFWSDDVRVPVIQICPEWFTYMKAYSCLWFGWGPSFWWQTYWTAFMAISFMSPNVSWMSTSKLTVKSIAKALMMKFVSVISGRPSRKPVWSVSSYCRDLVIFVETDLWAHLANVNANTPPTPSRPLVFAILHFTLRRAASLSDGPDLLRMLWSCRCALLCTGLQHYVYAILVGQQVLYYN